MCCVFPAHLNLEMQIDVLTLFRWHKACSPLHPCRLDTKSLWGNSCTCPLQIHICQCRMIGIRTFLTERFGQLCSPGTSMMDLWNPDTDQHHTLGIPPHISLDHRTNIWFDLVLKIYRTHTRHRQLFGWVDHSWCFQYTLCI